MALWLLPSISGTCQSRLKISCNSNSSSLVKTLSDVKTSGLIACLRAPSAGLALDAARAAITGGVQVLEVVMSTPGSVSASEGASNYELRVPEVIKHFTIIEINEKYQIGTILNAADAKHAIKIGAKFLMSPAMIKDIVADVEGSEVLYIPGVMTPTEILSAYNAGTKIVKIYPISALGGVEYISALKKPFPHIPMVASQGVKLGQVGEYITGGASAVVLSDAIFDKEAVARGDWNAISRQARLATTMADEAIRRLRLVKQRSFIPDSADSVYDSTCIHTQVLKLP